MEVHGYKAFYPGIVNRYGEQYDLHRTYRVSDDLAWQKSGFHFCENLEDVLRYYNGKEEDIIICRVIGSGNILKRYDEYNEYEIIISSHLTINSVMTREEIMNYAYNLRKHRLDRFINGFDLTDNEIDILLSNDSSRGR